MADLKTNTIDYFKNFLSDGKNKRLVSMLRSVLGELGTGLARTSVFFVRVRAANSNSCTSFKKAAVDAEVQRKDSFPIVAPYAVFFVRGFAALSDFLDKRDPKIPENLAERQALQDLLQFLTNTSEQSVLIENKEKCKTELEATLAVRLAQHLLVPLAPHKTFVIDSYPGLHLKGCCSGEHQMNVDKGDTSFGCPKGWHGRADILLMGDEIPFAVVESLRDERDLETVSVHSDSSVEVKNDENFTPESISQVTAQTIVYSFVQHKKMPKSANSMVPGIGICSKKLIVNLYDCIQDILVTTGPVDLYAQLGGCSLNLRAVIILWLALNHGLFGNKTPEKYRSNTADFHHVLGPVQLKAYLNESEQPFKAELDEEYLFKFFHDLNVETADSQDDITEYITDRMHVSLSLK